MLLFSLLFFFFFKLRDTQISSKGHHCGYPDPEGYTYFGKLVQGGVVARDDRDGWGATGPNMQDGVEVAAGPGQRGRLGTCAGGLAVHAGLYTGPKQKPLHTWSKNSGNKVIATYSSLHFCLLRQTN